MAIQVEYGGPITAGTNIVQVTLDQAIPVLQVYVNTDSIVITDDTGKNLATYSLKFLRGSILQQNGSKFLLTNGSSVQMEG